MKDDEMMKKKIMWKPEEDMVLKTYVEIHGEGNWSAVPRKLGLRRGGKSCRLRWRNYLRPDIKHGSMSKDEEDLILRMHKLIGNRWALISGRLPGRTDNEVKNYWNTYLSKKAPKRRAKTKSSTDVDDEKRAKIGHGSSQEEVINTNTNMVDVVKEEKLNNKHAYGETKELDDGEYWITSEDITGEIVVGSGSGAGNLGCGIMDMHFMDMNYDNQFTICGGEMDGHGLWDHGNSLLLDTFGSKWEDTPLPLP